MRCKNSGHNVSTESLTPHFLFFLYIRYNATQDEILSSSDLFSLSGTLVLVQIFLPGSKSAADMPFLLVHIKHLPDAMRKVRVDLFQTVGAVFMYRTLTNPKLLRSLTHGGFMFDNIIRDLNCSFFNIIFHKNNPCINCFLQSMQGHFDVCLHFPFERRGSPAKKSHSPSP